jgi:hypothetical protein
MNPVTLFIVQTNFLVESGPDSLIGHSSFRAFRMMFPTIFVFPTAAEMSSSDFTTYHGV